MKHGRYLLFICLIFVFSCSDRIENSRKIDQYPSIFPDYIGVTIPVNIAPLNFHVLEFSGKSKLVLSANGEEFTISSSGKFNIPNQKWRNLLDKNQGGQINFTVYLKEKEIWNQYKTFSVNVVSDSIDPYLVYRLIEPGYEIWNKMGIYQRNLSDFKEEAVYENRMTEYNCVNCHSFCMQNPSQMMFHERGKYSGTIISVDGKIQKLNTKTEKTMSPLVYPFWHPFGKFIAFSVNNTAQVFHENNPNRVEVYDSASDIVVYDTGKNEIFTTSLLFSPDAFETFPTFSPDGKRLYFCSATAIPMPEQYDTVKYSLCSISFDPLSKTFGTTVDTLYNARMGNRSVSFPRISPDGNYLMYTLSGYGNFSIWHKDADLQLIDLRMNQLVTMDHVNSEFADSYHSWSSNSRWFVFSSRRLDGLYTRPYIAHINRDGKIGKPFLLPQKDSEFYSRFMKSYNIPEFVKGKVELDVYEVMKVSKQSPGTNLGFRLEDN